MPTKTCVFWTGPSFLSALSPLSAGASALAGAGAGASAAMRYGEMRQQARSNAAGRGQRMIGPQDVRGRVVYGSCPVTQSDFDFSRWARDETSRSALLAQMRRGLYQ